MTRGWGGNHATMEKGERMDTTIEDRITRLLDQLENPHLKPREIDAIKQKIEFLEARQREQ